MSFSCVLLVMFFLWENKKIASKVLFSTVRTFVKRRPADYIKDKLSLYEIKSYVYKEKENKYRLYINYKNAIKLLDMIYYDSNVQKLDRKYQKYLLLKGSLN